VEKEELKSKKADMLKSIGKQSAESVESVVDGLVDFLHFGKNHAARNVNGHV